MPDLHHYDDGELVNPETHHETSDVNVKALFAFVVVFIVFAAVMHIALWVLFKQFAAIERHKQIPPLTAVPMPSDAHVPPLPRLQPFPTKVSNVTNPPNTNTPVTDMTDMAAQQNAWLHSYGWSDRQKGVVHIPIEVAKQLALQRGIYKTISTPAPAPAPQVPAAQGNTSP
jgi:hypothetical protein